MANLDPNQGRFRSQSDTFSLNSTGSKSSDSFSTGKQKKKVGSGLYNQEGTDQQWFLKASEDFPADDVAEVVASSLMNKLLSNHSSAQIAECRFFSKISFSSTESFVGSAVLPNFKDLTEGLVFPDRFIGSNPFTDANKAVLQAPFLGDESEKVVRLRSELSDVLVLNALVGNWDVQPKNMGLFKGTDKKWHVGAIDFGWALANFAGKDNVNKFRTQAFSLTGGKKILGSRGTHQTGAVPSNHFNDYPNILASDQFKQSCAKILQSLDSKTIKSMVEGVLEDTIEKHYALDQVALERAYQLLAEHMHLPKERYQDPISESGVAGFFRKYQVNPDNLKQAVKDALFFGLESRVNYLQKAYGQYAKPAVNSGQKDSTAGSGQSLMGSDADSISSRLSQSSMTGMTEMLGPESTRGSVSAESTISQGSSSQSGTVDESSRKMGKTMGFLRPSSESNSEASNATPRGEHPDTPTKQEPKKPSR